MDCLSEHDRIRVAVAVASISAAAAIYADNHQDRKPYHTSALTRQMYVDELLDSTNPNCMPDVLSVSCSVFMMLLEDLFTSTSLCDTQFGVCQGTIGDISVLRTHKCNISGYW
jgi:hypothetical protein